MRHAATLATAAVLSVASTSHGQTLVWSDEFAGTALNTANWTPLIGAGGWGNNELQYYTGRTENVHVQNGMLHIVARQENYQGAPYTSARLQSRFKQDFQYGRIEARIKVPATQGIWPAFWMLPTDWVYGGWAASGEIDVMETINNATEAHGTIHYGGGWPDNTFSGGSTSIGQSLGNAFHVYAIEWEPDQIRWFFDGNHYHTETSQTWFSDASADPQAPFNQQFHMLLNVAVGGNWPGYPNGSSVFPQEMQVDYVRVYDLASATSSPYGGTPAMIPGTVQAENYDEGGQGVSYFDADTGNNGSAYRTDDVDIEPTNEGGHNVGWIDENEWMDYSVDVQTGGTYLVECRVASQATGGMFRLDLDGAPLTPTMNAPVTGGWQNFQTISTTVSIPAGEATLRFVNESGPNDEYNLNWFRFTLDTTPMVREPFNGTPIQLPGFLQAEEFDLGGEGLAYSDTTVANTGGATRTGEWVDLISASEGTFAVTDTEPTEYLAYTVDIETAGEYSIVARVASDDGTGGALHIEADGIDISGPISTPVTQNGQTWISVGATADLNAGLTDLRVVIDDGGFNLNWLLFNLVTPSGPSIPDFDENGTVEVNDLLLFLSLWFNLDPSTECDGNTTIDVGDLLCFLVCWFNEGC